jgi:thioredoxin 1
MSDSVIEPISDTTFESAVLKADRPVIVDFHASWCGPCRAVRPIYEELGAEFSDTLFIASVDVDENPQIPTNYGITSIPTFLLFFEGEVVDRLGGAVPRSELRTLFERALAV